MEIESRRKESCIPSVVDMLGLAAPAYFNTVQIPHWHAHMYLASFPRWCPLQYRNYTTTNGVITSFWRFDAGATWNLSKYALRPAYSTQSRLPGPSQNAAWRTFKISPLARLGSLDLHRTVSPQSPLPYRISVDRYCLCSLARTEKTQSHTSSLLLPAMEVTMVRLALSSSVSRRHILARDQPLVHRLDIDLQPVQLLSAMHVIFRKTRELQLIAVRVASVHEQLPPSSEHRGPATACLPRRVFTQPG
jgi:hypothetical protein